MRRPAQTSTPEATPLEGADALRRFVRGHVPVLDGVRGLAIFLLLMHQFVLRSQVTSKPVRIFEDLLQIGWIGVQLFFVLSGFLITGILLDTKEREGYFRAFYVRRVLRIFPLYYLFLITVSIVLPHLFAVPAILRVEPRQMGVYWVYLSNWFPGGPNVLGHCWSLAVEEQFYIVWPLVVRVTGARSLLRGCLALAAGSLALRIGLWLEGADPEFIYENTLTRMDALVLGAAGAVLVRSPEAMAFLRPRLGRALALAAAALAVLAAKTGLPRTTALTQTLGYSLLSITFTLLILTAVLQQASGQGRIARALSSRPLRTLGTYSYGIYILQLPVHLFVSRVLLADVVAFRSDERYLVVQSAYTVGMLGVLLSLAWLSYHLFEKRFLALKRYFQVK